ncbi:MAG: hypothetical protein AAF721_16030 [Myxococcota bacterium]
MSNGRRRGGRADMTTTMMISVGAHALSGLGFLAFAAGFGLRGAWEPWHGEAVGQPWESLPAELRVVILAIMRAAAAGGLALAVAIGLLVWRLAQGDAFAIVALPAVSLTFAIPGAVIAWRFRQRTSANPPLGPAIVGIAVPMVGLIASLL